MKDIITSLAAKPMFGITTSTGATLLLWLKLMTPFVAFATVCVGLVAAMYSFITNYRKAKSEEVEIKIRELQLKRLQEEPHEHLD